MKEEERPGYSVIQVEAYDPDPINQGGQFKQTIHVYTMYNMFDNKFSILIIIHLNF